MGIAQTPQPVLHYSDSQIKRNKALETSEQHNNIYASHPGPLTIL